MSWFRNMRIATKLIISFMIIAFISVIIGVIGLLQMYKIESHVDEIGKVRLPSIEYLLIISEGQTALRLEEKALLDAELSHGERQNIYDEFDVIQSRIDHAWASYEALPHKEEEAEKWHDFGKLWTEWHKDIDVFMELSREVDVTSSTVSRNKLFAEMRELSIGINKKAYFEAEEGLQDVIKLNESLSNESIHDAHEAHDSSVWIIIGSIIIGILISIGLSLYISKIIGKPIHVMLKAAKAISEGNLDVEIDVTSKDEVGQLGQAFIEMTDNINLVMSNINNSSDQVAAGSRQLSESSMGLSQGATEQASSVEELTASVEEISSQTKANADNADQANSMASTAFSNAEKGNQHMIEMLKAMTEINESSNSISRIIKVIDDIAFQTNILALNAAVEAARAGQHGRGFAVVAEEVRNLAARSANAAKETTDMIEGSISKVEGGTKIANETAKALDEIVNDIGEVTELIKRIAIASNEQSLGVEQINQGLMQISNVVQMTSATAEETASASEELSGQADMLKEQVSTFKLKSYMTETEINQDVAQVLENMKTQSYSKQVIKETPIVEEKQPVDNSQVTQIKLSDSEFEKY